MTRFYDVTSGSLLLGGRKVQDYSKEDLLAQFALVPQKAQLFKGTIRDNLKYGNSQASDADLWEALKAAQAADFVSSKEGGLDFELEQEGRNLSGGQKQRLTIARALVKKAGILLLDDSDSALDLATSAKLRQNLAKLAPKPTTILVSQRASSVMQADQILVLDDGKLAGRGTHAELLKNNPVYQEIYYSQFPKEKEGE